MVEVTDGVSLFMLGPCIIHRAAMVTAMALLLGTGLNCIAASMTIYNDSLANGWTDSSYNCTQLRQSFAGSFGQRFHQRDGDQRLRRHSVGLV